jgi:transcriptional antiterminator NusG
MSDNTKQNHLEDEMDEVTTVPETNSISETELPSESPISESDSIPEQTPTETTEETEAPKDVPSTKTESATPTVFENVPANAKWFVLHTYSGHENRVAAAIRQRSEAMNIGNHVFDIVVPTRDTVTVKRGKKEEVKEKIFPGYILVRMILNDDSWLVVRTTPGVTAFVGIGNRPTPLSEKEVDSIMKFSQLAAPKFKAAFSKGEAVKIVDGPFADFLGTVDSIDEAKGKVKVLVSIFGRETPVELDFLQVSKL